MNIFRQKYGFSYISALIFVSVMGISLTAASTYWSTIIKRDKEQELLFRGDQIRRAIESYFNGGPGGKGEQYPGSLKDLLKDPRYPSMTKHLRKIYEDPMTDDGQWGIIMASGGRIKGVFSKSKDKPLKIGDFPKGYESFENAEKYSDWKFTHPLEKKSASAPPDNE